MATKKNVKKTARRQQKPKATVSELLAIFLQVITELYPVDKTAPGVVTAFIPTRKVFQEAKRKALEAAKKTGVYYASLCRYEGELANGKQILASAYGDTLDESLHTLIHNWQTGARNLKRLRQIVPGVGRSLLLPMLRCSALADNFEDS